MGKKKVHVKIHPEVFPNKIDPLVSQRYPIPLTKWWVGFDQQIKEHPELLESLGIAQPKGVLLYGTPGTGKTLLARAVAHHTDCRFVRVSSSELVQKHIGEGSRMVRGQRTLIIFMDEIDSIGSAQLLNQLDGFEATKNIKVVMATNRIDSLDPALLRPGRIGRKIEFPSPSEEARADILKIHTRKMNLIRGINLRKIAEKMSGSSGAEAGMFALRERRVHVTQEDSEMSVAKVMKKDSDANTSLKKLWK